MYTFREMRGNQRLLRKLRQTVQGERVSHAYMIHGHRGCGKKLLAHTFAKYLQCVQRGEEPCGVCKSCRVYDSGNHPDIIWVRSEKKSIGVEEIRTQVLEDMDIKPYAYKYKIYIIEKADTLSVQAQNALLKTLEEPPAYAVFLLLGEQLDAFLPTVLSRTAMIKINPLSEDEITAFLQETKGLEEPAGSLFAAYAQGSIGQALELMESEDFQQIRAEVLDMMQRLPTCEEADIISMTKALEKYKNDWRFLDIMELWYRDVLVAKCLRHEKFIIQKDIKNTLFQGAGEAAEVIGKKIEAIQEARMRLAQNANFRLSVEVMLFRIKENESK